MRGSAVALIAALAASGCKDLPDVAAGECGNGVLELGEDCDSFAPEGARCATPEEVEPCRFACDETATCPEGWGCGVDGVCRHPSGALVPLGATLRLEGVLGAVADVDSDDKLDLVASGAAGISAWFGDESGAFAESADLSLRISGLASVGDLSDDGTVAVAAPFDVGAVVFEGTEAGDLRSVPLSSVETETGDRLRAIAVTTGIESLDNVLLITDEGMCFVGDCDKAGGVEPLPDSHGLDELADRIPVAELDSGGFFFEEFAIAAQGESTVWVYEVVGIGGGEGGYVPQIRNQIALPGPARSAPRFADRDGDGRLDLMILVHVGSENHVAVAMRNLLGGFDAAAVEPAFDNFTPTCGSSRWPLAVGHLNPDSAGGEALDYVGDAAICLWVPLIGFVPIAVPTVGLPFSEAVIDDFNGDGHMDVAAGFSEADSVDFFLGNGRGLFNPANVPTSHPTKLLRVGDFDGNFITDLAFAERADTAGEAGQDVSVIFGGSDGVSREPTVMARFGEVDDLEPVDLVLSAATLDGITDLGVVSRVAPDQGSWAVGVLYGNASRRMISPALVGQLGLASPIGRFATAGGTTTGRGVLAITAETSGRPAVIDEIRLTLVRDELGTFGAKETWTVDPASTHFGFACAVYAAVDLDGDGDQELVGIHGPGEAWMPLCDADPARDEPTRLLSLDVSDETAAPLVADVPGGYQRPLGITPADLDLDGQPEVIVTYRSGDVVIYRASDGALELAGGVALSGLDAPLAAAALVTRPGLPPSVAVLCEGGIYIADPGADGSFGTPAREAVTFDAADASGPNALFAGDIDGDGLVDLVAQRAGRVQVFRAEPAEAGE